MNILKQLLGDNGEAKSLKFILNPGVFDSAVA